MYGTPKTVPAGLTQDGPFSPAGLDPVGPHLSSSVPVRPNTSLYPGGYPTTIITDDIKGLRRRHFGRETQGMSHRNRVRVQPPSRGGGLGPVRDRRSVVLPKTLVGGCSVSKCFDGVRHPAAATVRDTRLRRRCVTPGCDDGARHPTATTVRDTQLRRWASALDTRLGSSGGPDHGHTHTRSEVR